MARDEIDDLVDGLNVIGPAPSLRSTYFKVPKWLAFTVPVCALILGAACGLGDRASNSTMPRPSVTVTKYATQTRAEPTLPADCARAIVAIRRMMEANAVIAGAGEEQMDIAHAARRAIFLKDWKALDAAMNRQVELNNRLGKPNNEALRRYADLEEATEACERAV